MVTVTVKTASSLTLTVAGSMDTRVHPAGGVSLIWPVAALLPRLSDRSSHGPVTDQTAT